MNELTDTVTFSASSAGASAATIATSDPTSHVTTQPAIQPGGLPLKDAIIHALDSKKAQDIIVIDLVGKSDIADYMVVATGTSTTHLSALADHVRQTLEAYNEPVLGIEGVEPPADWVLIDNPEIMVHLFLGEAREYYNLERMWEASFEDESTAAANS